MIYMKSFLAGLLVLVLTTLIALGLVFASMLIMVRRRPPEAGIVSFDVGGPWIPLWLMALFAISTFAAGVSWNLRRIRRHQ